MHHSLLRFFQMKSARLAHSYNCSKMRRKLTASPM